MNDKKQQIKKLKDTIQSNQNFVNKNQILSIKNDQAVKIEGEECEKNEFI